MIVERAQPVKSVAGEFQQPPLFLDTTPAVGRLRPAAGSFCAHLARPRDSAKPRLPISRAGLQRMRVAIAQLAPVFLDRAATTARARDAILEAACHGAQIVVFGETFLPAYPLWLARTDGARFDDADQKTLHAAYLAAAVDVSAGDLKDICSAAAEAAIAVVIGFAERTPLRGHTIFCSRAFIDRHGHLLSVHRKLMPTYEERLAWGIGDGNGLVTHRVGDFTVGALNCWENWMPLARAALYAQGEDFHIALWPGSLRLTEDVTRFIAREARSYVLSASAIIRPRDLPPGVPCRDRICSAGEELFYDGGSCIADPRGEWIASPIVGEERIIYADLDPAVVRAERQNFDPAGHYARPDILRLAVDRRRQTTADFLD